MNDELPFVSFCLTSYNQRQYIADAVRGALSQDYPNMEIIISDDGSSDDSVEVIKQTVAEFGRGGVKLLESDRNIGIIGNYERMFKAAKGELFVGADGDDISLSNRVSEIVKAWKENGRKATVIFHDGIKIDPQGNEVGIVTGRTIAAPLGALMSYSPVCITKFPAVSEMNAFQDHVYGRRCAMFGEELHIAERLIKYRVGSGVSSVWSNRRFTESKVSKIRQSGYLQSLKDVEAVRHLIGELTYAALRTEYSQGIEREKAGLALRQSRSFFERWCAWRSLYPRMNKGAILYIPYLFPAALGDLLFDAQTKVKYFLYKLRRSSHGAV